MSTMRELLIAGHAGNTPWKLACRSVAVSNITLSGEQTVSGVALTDGDRCLVASQTAGRSNGPYVVRSGSWERAQDFDRGDRALPGSAFMILEGTYAGKVFQLTSPTSGTVTVGSTSLTFAVMQDDGRAIVSADDTADATAANSTTTYTIPEGYWGEVELTTHAMSGGTMFAVLKRRAMVHRFTGMGVTFTGCAALVFDDSGASYTDETTDAFDSGTADVLLFPTTEAVGDAFLIGCPVPFTAVEFNQASGQQGVNGGSLDIEYEYYNGSTWATLAGVTDATSQFTAALTDGQVISWTQPSASAWPRATFSTFRDLHWVRFRIAAGSYSTNPRYDSIRVIRGGETVGNDLVAPGLYGIRSELSCQSSGRLGPRHTGLAATNITWHHSTSVKLRAL